MGSRGATVCVDRAPPRGAVKTRIYPVRRVGCTGLGRRTVRSGPARHKWVALTFDDGPSLYTDDVLRILDHNHVHATFFQIGQQVPAYAGLERKILAHGNELANHSWRHATGPGEGDLRHTSDVIEHATGFRPCAFRPPGGYLPSSTAAAAAALGMVSVIWDVDTRDWTTPGSALDPPRRHIGRSRFDRPHARRRRQPQPDGRGPAGDHPQLSGAGLPDEDGDGAPRRPLRPRGGQARPPPVVEPTDPKARRSDPPRGTVSGRRLSRRAVIGAGAAAGAGLALPGGSAAAPGGRGRRRRIEADVVVVGAGFAGLTAALAVKRGGHSVAVLEARSRVGGRVAGHRLPSGEFSERGGTFVGPTQDRILAALDRFGIGTFPTYDEGSNVYVNGGQRMEFSDTGFTGSAPPDPLILPELITVVTRLDQMSTSVPVGAPWKAANAGEWDAQTLAGWIAANSATERFRRLVPAATRPIFGADPGELSLLYVLFYIAASGNESNPGSFERNFNTRGGAQERRIEGGSQVLGQAMAAALGKRRIVKRSPVRRIVQRRERRPSRLRPGRRGRRSARSSRSRRCSRGGSTTSRRCPPPATRSPSGSRRAR